MDKAIIEKIIQPKQNIKTQQQQKKRILASFWSTVKKAAGYVPFMQDVVAAFYCAFDPTTSKKTQAILLAALAYFVMPFDIVPDFLALVGFSDDLAVLTLAIATVKASMKEKHYQAAAKVLFEETEAKNNKK